jgi:hypothetical protein
LGFDNETVALYVLDEAMHYTWVHAKSSYMAGIAWFREFLPRLEKRSGRARQELITDNCPELLSSEFNFFLGDRGVSS